MLNVVVYPSYHNGIYIFFNTTYKYFVHFYSDDVRLRLVRLVEEEEEALSDFFFLLVTILPHQIPDHNHNNKQQHHTMRARAH